MKTNSSLANYYYSNLPKAQVGKQTTTDCPEGFQWNTQRNVCTTPDGKTFEELKAENDAAWGNIKTALATGAGLGAAYAARNHPLVTTIPSVVKNKAFKPYGEALLMEALQKGSYPLAKLPVTGDLYKAAAKIVGSQSMTADRSLKQILSLKPGNYTGLASTQIPFIDAEGNFLNNEIHRNALNNYIYGNDYGYTKSNVPYRGLEKYEKIYNGPFKTYALDDINTAKGEALPIENYAGLIQNATNKNKELKFPELQNLSGKDLHNAIRELIKKNGTLSVGNEADLLGRDDIGGHMLHFDHDAESDKIHLTTQDIWKFTPEDYGDKWSNYKGKNWFQYLQKAKDEHAARLNDTNNVLKFNLKKGEPFEPLTTKFNEKALLNTFLGGFSKFKQAQLMDRAGRPFVLIDKRAVSFPNENTETTPTTTQETTTTPTEKENFTLKLSDEDVDKANKEIIDLNDNIDDAVKYTGKIYQPSDFGKIGPVQPTPKPVDLEKLKEYTKFKHNQLIKTDATKKLEQVQHLRKQMSIAQKQKLNKGKISTETINDVLKNKVYSDPTSIETSREKPTETKNIEGLKTEEGLNTLKNLLGNFIKFGSKAKEEYGGDISLPNVYPNHMQSKFAYGGPLQEYYQGKMNGPNMFGPGGQTTDGCPPYFKKHPVIIGLCIPDGQISDEQKKLIGLPVAEQQGPTMANLKKLNDAIGRNSINKIVAQQKANGTYIPYTQGQQAQFNVYDEAKARQGQLIHDEQMRLQAQANSDLSQTMGSFTPQQYADYTAPGGAGSIGANTQLAATALPVAASSVAIAAPTVAAALEAPLLGNIGTQYGTAALTGHNLINAGFFYKGAKNLPNVSNAWKNFNEHPTWGNIGDAAAETGMTTLDMLGFTMGAAKGIPSVLQDVNMFGDWAAKNAPGKDLLVAGALSKRLAFGKPKFNIETPTFAKRIDPIGRSSVNVKNDFLKEMSPEEYDQFVKSIYDKIGYAYDQPFVEFKSSKPISFMQGVGIDPTGSQREAMLLKEKFCAPGSECAKTANAVTNRMFTDITGQSFDALGNAHNAWHMEDQMTRNGAINLRGRFPLKVGDRILMGNNVNQSTYVPGFTADPRVRHAGVFAGMHQTPSGDVFPMLFESGKNNPLYLNPTQSTFTGPNTILEAIRPQQFLDNTFGEALVDKNIRYAFRNKPAVASFSSDNPAVQKLLTDAEPFRETIKRTYDITNDEFNELLNSLVSVGAQETKLNGLLPGSKLAKAKIQLQNTLNRFDLLKPIKQGVNLVKQTINSGALPTDFRLPAYPGASKIEMEAAKYAAENDVPFESAVRQIKSQYQPKPKFSLSTIEPSKGLFRQKYQTETDRLSNFGSDIKSKNSIENGLGQMSENYNKVKNMYPDATPRQLMDITTLMWNSPGKALNPELVDFYIFGKNNPNPSKFNFDYITKVNKFKDRYINVKPQLVDPHLDILQNGKYPVIQYAKGGQPPVNPNGMYDGVRDWRIPGGNITMKGVPFPVLAKASNGMTTMMYPGQDYNFPGAKHVDEYPMMRNGGLTKYQIKGQVTEDEKTDAEKIADAKAKELDYQTKWYNSPKYKEIMGNQISPGEEWMLDERQKRFDAVNGVPLISYNDNTALGELNGYDKLKEGKDRILLNVRAHDDPHVSGSQTLDETIGHEWNHFINNRGQLIPKNMASFIDSLRNVDPNAHKKYKNLPSFFDTPLFKTEVAPYAKYNKFASFLAGQPVVSNVKELDEILRKRNETENWKAIYPYDNKKSPETFNTLKFYNNYYNRPGERGHTEYTSLVNKVRQDAAELGLYNPFTEDFTEDTYNKFLQLGNTDKTRDFRELMNWNGTDDEGKKKTIKTFNTVAKNENKQTSNMAKYGGGLLSRTVTCSRCGWSWKATDGGADPMTCHKCGGTIKMKQGGGPGDSILDNIYAKWPALKKLGNVTIKPDESFTRDKTGVGDIEFFGPNTPQVTYNNGYVAQNPGVGGYGILYNPSTNDEQNIRLDMLHGMSEADPRFRRLRNRFEHAIGHTDIKNEMNHWYNQALQKGEAEDGKQQWMDNYTDGQLRTLLYEGDRSKQNYSDEEANQLLSHPRVKRKFNKINNYLKKGKDGGETNFKNNSPLLEFYYSKTKR